MSRAKSRIALVCSAVLVAIASLFVASPPASAAWSDCPNGWFCLFAGPNGTGGVMYTAAQPAQLGWMANNADSYWNRTTWVYCFYAETDHRQKMGQMSSGWQGNITGGENNIESLAKLGFIC